MVTDLIWRGESKVSNFLDQVSSESACKVLSCSVDVGIDIIRSIHLELLYDRMHEVLLYSWSVDEHLIAPSPPLEESSYGNSCVTLTDS